MPLSSERHALVVGAGLAGCAAAWALANQGWQATLFDRLPAIASAASGNRGGIFHGIVNAQDGMHARFNRAAALHAEQAARIATESYGAAGQVRGLLRLELTSTRDAMQAQLDALGLPREYVQALASADASSLSGLPLSTPAWMFPGGGWIRPADLAAAFLQRAAGGVDFRGGIGIAALRRHGERWQLLDAAGGVIGEAAVVVLANAIDATRLLGVEAWPLQLVRGQTSELPATTPGLRLPLLPVTGDGYVLPALPGAMALFGATSQRGDPDPEIRHDDHRHNLERLARLTGSAPRLDAAMPEGRVGWRCVADDRLPVIGPVPDRQAASQPGQRLDQPRFVPRMPGLFVLTALASRGITWAALGAQSLAALVSGAPCPLEASLLDAVDAGRFVSRESRRATKL